MWAKPDDMIGFDSYMRGVGVADDRTFLRRFPVDQRITDLSQGLANEVGLNQVLARKLKRAERFSLVALFIAGGLLGIVAWLLGVVVSR